jgi:hypothetical protein
MKLGKRMPIRWWKDEELHMDEIVNHFQAVRAVWPKIAPYVLIELALPGGTLLAVLLFFYRRLRTGNRVITGD